MRLYQDEKRVLDDLLASLEGEAYLFGSQVDDTQRGGDVDLLVFSAANPFHLSLELSRKFFMASESKLDVVVMDKENLTDEQEAFLKSLKLERLK